MIPTRTLVLTAILLIISLITLAHIHPSTSFEIPYIPTYHPGPNIDLTPPSISAANNRQLSHAECLEVYPELYAEADRARRWYAKKGGISGEDVDNAAADDASARVVIIGNQMYVKNFFGSINTRTYAALAAIWATVLTSPEPMPDVDFVIQITDGGGGTYPHFVLDRRAEQEALWLMPDFGFFSWPEPGVGAYNEVRQKSFAYEESLGLVLKDMNGSTRALQSSWGKKEKKLMWRGVPMVEVRQELIRASAGQTWSDVRELNWGAVNQDEEGKQANNGDLKSPAEHCAYQFLAHVEGWAYSGRLKYLQQCRSVVVAHPLEYIQHYHHLLDSRPGSPTRNIVEVQRPLEEHLPAMMNWLLDPANEEEVERIADNQWWGLREGYISPAANECYYRYALRAYAEVQTFQPKIGEGVPYESFLLMGRTHWDPHR